MPVHIIDNLANLTDASSARSNLGLTNGSASLSFNELNLQRLDLTKSYPDPDGGSRSPVNLPKIILEGDTFSGVNGDGQSIDWRWNQSTVTASIRTVSVGSSSDQLEFFTSSGGNFSKALTLRQDVSTFTGGIAASSATISGGTLTSSQPLTLNQTWSSSGTTFTGLQVNITDSASAAASQLFDLRVGGTSRFSVNKAGVIVAAAGSRAQPSITFSGASTMGFWNDSNTQIRISSGNTDWIGFTSTTINLPTGSSINWNGDTFLFRDASNILAQRNSTTAQTFRLYNTFTSSTSFERLNLRWLSNVICIGTEKGTGGGVARDLSFETDGVVRMTVTSTGTVNVVGHFTAATKSFKIPHQTKKGYLQYGVVESNEHGVYVRGQSKEETIHLPEHWEWLVDENSVTVKVTPVGSFQPLFIISKDNKTVKIGGVEGEYNYTIYGTRKDVGSLQVELED
jgi:hypothetical protein